MAQRTGTLEQVTLDHSDDAIVSIVKKLASGRDTYLVTSGRRHRRFAPLLADSETELLDWNTAISRFLSLSGGSPKPLAPERIQIQAIERAIQSLPPGNPFESSGAFRGTALTIARTLSELESWCIWDFPHADFGEYDKSLLEGLFTVRAERAAQLQTLGRGTLGANFRSFLFDPPTFKLDCQILLISDLEDGTIPFRLSERLAELGANVTHVEFESVDFQPINATVTLEASGDRLAETEWAIRRCASQIALGVPADQIVIFARHLREYGPLLTSTAARYDVPVAITHRFPLLSNGYAKLMLGLLISFQSRDPRDFVQSLRSSFLSVGRAEYLQLDELARRSVAKADPWEVFESEVILLEGKKLTPTLEWRSLALKASMPIREWIEQFKRLFAELPLAEEVFGDSPDKERNARAQTVMSQALAAHATLSKTRFLNLGEFLTIAEEEWSNADVSSPAEDDGIQIVDNIDAFASAKCVHVLGMIEGEFPRRRTEDPVLSDRLRNQLSDALGLDGHARLRTSHDRAQQERNLIARLTRLPSESLLLSYPVSSNDSESVPAYILQEIKPNCHEFAEIAHERNTWIPENPEIDVDKRLAKAFRDPKQGISEATLSAKTRRSFALPQDYRFEFRELEDAVQCPFRHFVKHRLRVSSSNEFSRWSALINIPGRARLAAQNDEGAARMALEMHYDATVDQLVGEVDEWEINLMRAVRDRFIDGWVKREFTAREAWERDQTTLREDRQVNVKPENPIFPGVGIRDSLPFVYENGGLPSTQIYRRTGKPEPEYLLDYRLFQSTLMCVLLWNSGGTIEIDHGFGSRTLFVWNARHGFRHTRPLEVISPAPIKLKNIKRDLQALVQSAARSVTEVNIEPTPDEHCIACDYGELCRASREFAEYSSPFGFSPQDA